MRHIGPALVGVALGVFLLALVALALLYVRLYDRTVALENELRQIQAQSQKTGLAGKLHITAPRETPAMVRSGRISVEGTAEDNSVIMLLSGGKILAVTVPEQGRFRFSDVRLRRGENHLFVQMMTPGGRTLDLEELVLRYNSPSFAYLSRPFDRGSLTEKAIALTFDGGSIDNVSGEILDFLKEHRVKATFFLTGEFVRRFPETVRRIVAEGHEVGNHTMTHPHLTTFAENHRHDTRPGITRKRVQQELIQMAEAFKKVTGKNVAPIWRAPYGEHNREIREWAAEIGYREVGWTVGHANGESMDTRDWVARPTDPGYRTAQQIEDAIFRFAEQPPHGANGAIVLMHLGSHRNGDFPHRKLPEIIEGLRQRGYRFVTVTQLMNL